MITKDFLLSEVQQLESELEKAKSFTVQAQAVIAAYTMLLAKFDEPEEVEENIDGNAN
jgi:predicted RecB family nuclease